MTSGTLAIRSDMRTWLIGLVMGVMLLGAAAPLHGDHQQLSVEQIVKDSQCTARVVTSDVRNATESHYNILQHTLYIGTNGDIEPDFALIVIFHELGHCRQYQEFTIPQLNQLFSESKERELDADMRGADMACRAGLNAPKVGRRLFEWAKEKFNYDGDSDHGTVAERIAAMDRAPSCLLRYKVV